ncbi:MAG: hypothetical protein K2Q10_01085, partial [Rhodospirillales bacterium]|nr:hypothetical protein [Rhodospirillales bacterium]
MRYFLAMMAVLTTVMVATRVFVSNDVPPEQPIARIEIGLHSGRVTAIATDREGTLAVTVALDKTARVWSLPEGRLLRVLRPPISEGPEGALNAVAISSDGATIAVAGMTGGGWDDGSYSVYVFDRASGRMLHRLGGLPSPVLRLSFTRDDMVLAASLAGPHGLRMWRMEDKTLALYDPDYGGSAPWFAFDAQNRLATVSDDGRVRLYDPQARHAAEVKAPGGQHPHRIVFSPDGKTLAVTYADSARVDILAVSDLRLLHSADIEGLRRPHFDAVAWSGDGQTLVAGGNVLRRWTEAGRGDASDLSLDIEAITQLRLLPRRNLMLVNGESRFVMLADVRDSLYTVPTASIDGPAAPHPLGLSADGTSLEFARDGGALMRFDV